MSAKLDHQAAELDFAHRVAEGIADADAGRVFSSHDLKASLHEIIGERSRREGYHPKLTAPHKALIDQWRNEVQDNARIVWALGE